MNYIVNSSLKYITLTSEGPGCAPGVFAVMPCKGHGGGGGGGGAGLHGKTVKVMRGQRDPEYFGMPFLLSLLDHPKHASDTKIVVQGDGEDGE